MDHGEANIQIQLHKRAIQFIFLYIFVLILIQYFDPYCDQQLYNLE